MNAGPPTPPKEAARLRREKRLAEALRQNLRRRKAAGRPVAAAPASRAKEPPQGRPCAVLESAALMV
jgi:hypothetical protein